MANIQFKLTGSLAPNNSASLRVLGYLCMNFQSALNRAYLEVKHGHVRKYQRISDSDYLPTNFYFSGTAEGSFIVDFLEDTPIANKISKKLSGMLSRAYDLINRDFEQNYFSKAEQVDKFQERIENGLIVPKSYAEFKQSPPAGFYGSYSSRSAIRSIATALTPLKKSEHTDDSISIKITHEDSAEFFFNRDKATKIFHLSNDTSYLTPVKYKFRIVEMNEETLTAEARNVDNLMSKQKIRFANRSSFDNLRINFGENTEVNIYASPCSEYATLDVDRGDVLYVSTIS